MPRQAREKSNTGTYHIMLRGINGQVIFEDREDIERFLQTLRKYKDISIYKILAYCIMSNHIHILLKIGEEGLDVIMKRIAGSYVYWYNSKYSRRGHLFQDRFKSEPVKDISHLLTVLRYIHQNPVKAGLCTNIENYKFSSYHDFMFDNSALIDIDFVFSIINMSKEEFIKFNNATNEDNCLELNENTLWLSDETARAIIEKTSNCKNTVEFQSLDRKQRDAYIRKLKEQGLPIRQISRLTGISYHIVRIK